MTGRTFAEEATDAKETPGQEVVRPLTNPIKTTGGLVILKGNLAPEGCVIKVAGYRTQAAIAVRRACSNVKKTPCAR